MKLPAYLLPLLLLGACASTSGIKSLKADATATSIANCDTCVEVRIMNTGVNNISSVMVTNSHGDEYYFEGVKAGKASPYKKMYSFCSCGYSIDTRYYMSDSNDVTLHRSCQNILPCNDFYKGKVTLEINTAKLPANLRAKEAQRTRQEINIKKD